MAVKFDVNACLEAAMRANPYASREFLTKALTQTLNNAGQATNKAHVEAQFDLVRTKVGSDYKGAPLHANHAVRIYSCEYLKTKSVTDEEEVQESQFGSDLKSVLGSRGGLDVNQVFIVGQGPGQPYEEESDSLVVRVKVDTEGNVSVIDIPENESGKEEGVRKAFEGLSLPEDSIAPGVYDLQIGFAAPAAPEGRS